AVFFTPATRTYGAWFTLNATLANTQGVALTPDGETSLAGLGGGEMARSLSFFGAITNLPTLFNVFGIRSLAAPDLLAATTSGVARYSLATNTTRHLFPFPTTQFSHNLEVTPDRTRAVALGDAQVAVLDLATDTISHTIPLA